MVLSLSLLSFLNAEAVAGPAGALRLGMRPECMLNASAIDTARVIRLCYIEEGVPSRFTLHRSRDRWRVSENELVLDESGLEFASRQLTKIEVRDGDGRARGVLIGSITGLVAAPGLSAWMSARERGGEFRISTWEGAIFLALPCVFGGAVAGSLVGRFFPRFRTCYDAEIER